MNNSNGAYASFFFTLKICKTYVKSVKNILYIIKIC